MSKTEYAWVIQRDDGMFAYYSMFSNQYEFSTRLMQSNLFSCETTANDNIIMCKLQNCKPVKIEIRVVGE